MPKRKPIGWPRYMVAKRLSCGATAYYWSPPTWAAKAGCTMGSVALGRDYGAAKARCDDVINPFFDAWRRKGAVPAVASNDGTFDWLVAVYKDGARYTKLPPGTRADYDRALNDVSRLATRDGTRRFGEMPIKGITPGAADKIYERLKIVPDGKTRGRSAALSMVVCKVAWNAARRIEPKAIPSDNPFKGMQLNHKPEATRPVSHDELVAFVASADAMGHASVGTAAMIAYYWLQRQVDILGLLSWTHYRPDGKPEARIWHHKTGELVDVPLLDDDGSHLWPEMVTRLDASPRHGTLIVMRDQPDRTKKVHLPWKEDYFRHVVANIREAAGITKEAKFMGLRHGGTTEGADAGLSDAQLRALSGHKGASMLVYARETTKQRREGARMRRDSRRKNEP